MLIKINLLASDKIVKEERTEYLTLGYALLVIVSVSLIGMYAAVWNATNKLDKATAAREAELSKYQTIVQQVEQLQATKKVLEMKKNVIDSLRASGLLYPWFMQTLAARTPAGIGYKSMTTTLTPAGGLAANMDAMATDNYAIADCIGVLSTDPEFSLVDLGAITAIGAENSSASNFRLTFNYTRKKD